MSYAYADIFGLKGPKIKLIPESHRWSAKHVQAAKEFHKSCGFNPGSKDIAKFWDFPCPNRNLSLSLILLMRMFDAFKVAHG